MCGLYRCVRCFNWLRPFRFGSEAGQFEKRKEIKLILSTEIQLSFFNLFCKDVKVTIIKVGCYPQIHLLSSHGLWTTNDNHIWVNWHSLSHWATNCSYNFKIKNLLSFSTKSILTSFSQREFRLIFLRGWPTFVRPEWKNNMKTNINILSIWQPQDNKMSSFWQHKLEQ